MSISTLSYNPKTCTIFPPILCPSCHIPIPFTKQYFGDLLEPNKLTGNLELPCPYCKKELIAFKSLFLTPRLTHIELMTNTKLEFIQ